MHLRVLFVTNNYLPYSGGVVHSINTSAQALRALGHQVYIVTLDFGSPCNDTFVIRLKCPIKFRYKKNAMAIPWRAYKQLQEQIAALKPDIVHTHHPFLLGQVACRIAQKRGIPTVFTYHTLYEEYAHYVPLPGMITRSLIRSIVHRYCSTVDGIIAPSEPIQEYLYDQAIDRPITVIPSSIRSPFLYTNFPNKQRQEHEPFRLLVVSRFVPEKNLEALLQVCATLDDNFTLLLAGYGYAYEQLQHYAYTTLSLSPDKVKFVCNPDQEKLVKLYAEADIFLFSSHTDTQGLVLAEAMAAGTPVIAFDGPGQRAIIQQGVNGFVVGNKEHMRETIMLVAQNKSLLCSLQYNAWKTAQCYTPHVMAEKLMGLYTQVK